MLEKFATGIVSLSEQQLTLLSYGAMALGAVLAGIREKSEIELARAPYFAYSSFFVFAMTAIQMVWLMSLSAIMGGYLWVLVLVAFGGMFAGGYLVCKVAMARSRDISGGNGSAFLAFIPLANLWLLFKTPKVKASSKRAQTVPLMTGGLGVVTGLVFLIGTVSISKFIEIEAQNMGNGELSEKMTPEESIDFLIRTQGLPRTIELMASEANTPIKVDDVTTLKTIEAYGNELRRTYSVNLETVNLSDEFRAGVKNEVCGWSPFMTLLRAGGTIREEYFKVDGSHIVNIAITRNECGI